MRCCSVILVLALLLLGACSPDAGREAIGDAAVHRASATAAEIYLHGSGPVNNPPVLFLDGSAPLGSNEKYRDSAGLSFQGGNPWKEIGSWNAASGLLTGDLTSVQDLRVWLGLKNSDDQGTRFDLRAEMLRDSELLASGETYLITGLTRNASKAKEVTVSFAALGEAELDSGDEISLRILARIGTDGNGGFGGGHSNATGLRLYFDAVSRDSHFGAVTNLMPAAVASADQLSGPAPLLVNFSAAGSNDPDGSIAVWEWDLLGDGNFQDFTATLGTTAITYPSPGLYEPVLRITDDSGASAVDSLSIEVEAAPELQDEWATFGHDVNHTHRSPFAGPVTNALKWTYNSGDDIASAVSLAPDGTLYFGGNNLNFKLVALNPDGTLKWTYPTGLFTFSTPAVGADGTVYMGCADNKMYAVNPDGTLQWSYTTGAQIYSSPTLGPDGTIYFGSWDHKVYALNPDGSLQWTYLTGHIIFGAPSLAADGTIYVGSRDGKLYALNPDGSSQWIFSTGGNFDAACAIQPDGSIIAANSVTKRVYSLNPDGTLQWSYLTGGRLFSNPALDAGGRIFIGADDGLLYAINPDSSLAWTYATGALIFSSPAIDAAGRIYFGSDTQSVYALNPDGSLLWTHATAGIVRASPSIGADGSVYIGSFDNKIYAFGPGGP